MIGWKDAAKRQFDTWSRSYDYSILQLLFFRPSHKKLIDVAHIPPNGHVLDVGCGTGKFARRILRRFPSVQMTGLDLSRRMLDRAPGNCADVSDRIRFVHGDAEHLPFDDDSFDVVTCIHSFHHYPNQASVVNEMFRVLKPEGRLVILDANRDGWWGWIIFDGFVATIEGLVHHCSAERFHNLFDQCGFESIEQTRGGWLAPFLITQGIASRSAEHRQPAEAA